ncbi:hypothetical protein [Microbacterium mangrovi]|uniref:hypothetical protein n=1 Tax=Microbacterium mangrovi TaxID=1348253 RepID=UPI00068B0880|nr:hypothetical protein [Microbacterium mangrovi]
MAGHDILTRRSTAVFWFLSGAFFVAYPAIRPFSDERGMTGAAAFASPWWLVAHLSAVAAFSCALVALAGTYSTAPTHAGAARVAWLLQTLGICLILPFYGAEAYGLHALGQAALSAGGQDTASLVSLASDVRGGAGLTVFLLGAAALGVGAVFGVRATEPMTIRRWGAIVLGLAEILLVPQFFADQPLRVAHGILFLLGTVLYAVALRREQPARRLEVVSV